MKLWFIIILGGVCASVCNFFLSSTVAMESVVSKVLPLVPLVVQNHWHNDTVTVTEVTEVWSLQHPGYTIFSWFCVLSRLLSALSYQFTMRWNRCKNSRGTAQEHKTIIRKLKFWQPLGEFGRRWVPTLLCNTLSLRWQGQSCGVVVVWAVSRNKIRRLIPLSLRLSDSALPCCVFIEYSSWVRNCKISHAPLQISRLFIHTRLGSVIAVGMLL